MPKEGVLNDSIRSKPRKKRDVNFKIQEKGSVQISGLKGMIGRKTRQNRMIELIGMMEKEKRDNKVLNDAKFSDSERL